MLDGYIAFSEFPLADWPWGGESGTLGIFSNVQWTDIAGVVHLSNAVQDASLPQQQVPVVVTGRRAVVQGFVVAPTISSIDVPAAKLSGVLFDDHGIARQVLFLNWYLPTSPNPMTWRAFTLSNHTRRRRLGDHYGTWAMTLALFNNISFITAEDLARLPTARGSAVMVDGSVVVDSVLVTDNSLIKAWSVSNGVSGNLRVEQESYNVAQDFTVTSTNDLDNGLVGWELTEPF